MGDAPVAEFDQIIAQYASKLKDQEASLKKSIDEKVAIEEELHRYRNRNIGLEEKYQFMVEKLDTQREITTKTRGEFDLLKLEELTYNLLKKLNLRNELLLSVLPIQVQYFNFKFLSENVKVTYNNAFPSSRGP